MSISSKRIISYIDSQETSFNANRIAHDLLAKKSNKKKKTSKRFNSRDVDKIDQTIKALYAIGYLTKNKKSYTKSVDFVLQGIIKINSSGNGILRTEDGNEIIIKKEYTGKAHNNDLVEVRITSYNRDYFQGIVNKIIKREREQYFAKVIRKTNRRIFFKLLDTSGEVEVYGNKSEEDIDPDIGDKAIVKLCNRYHSGLQECKIVRFFLPDENYDVQRIICKHSLPEQHEDYEELSDINESINNIKSENRKDYRSLYTITIDGEDAKDFDDAVSLEFDDDKYRLYIHIADVSDFVKIGGMLDKEALRRTTSFYLGNCVIPMLPEILSNDYCSLKEGEDRLVLSVEICFDKEGNELECAFNSGIIKVDKRLTYNEASDIILQKKRTELSRLLNDMYTLSDLLKQKRLSEGRIDLTLADYKIVYIDDVVKDIEYCKRLKSHILIEEFMLSANTVVSRTLREKNIPSIYRIHETIPEEKRQVLRDFLSSLNLHMRKKGDIGIVIQEIIDKVAGNEFEQVVNFIVLKSFMQAYYGVESTGHFGLGFRDYTHFTSPIRRYPDLVVHRCLKSLGQGSQPPYTKDELAIIAQKCSEMERIAQAAERDLIKLASCRLMENCIGEEYDAIISGISKSGFFVSLIDRPFEGMVPLRFLTDDYYLVKEDEFTVVGKKLGRRFRVGDRIVVRLKSIEIDTIRIDFDVV
ncbi:MAG: VacB/RNase II family 3'-5' exoribonuclease [Spirochaetota bacterium]|nr:VacB/RNase II family 3'-5' exoribonuclease [Spirochaetota bacterium]